ncbi:MAG: DedA family protein [Chloroflexaceae bacterium]|nr:DedA family protein [Chloroflexaceae bacterium]
MAELLEYLRVWVEQIILQLGYVGIILLMTLETVFPPIPSELMLPFAGSLVAQGELNLMGVLVASTFGAVLGALVLYGVGQWANDVLVRSFLRRYGRWFWLSEDDYDRALHLFKLYGMAVVLVGRVMPLIRSLVSLPAGMNRMAIGIFLALTTLGSLLWNIILVSAGYVLGEHWPTILGWVDQYENVILFAIALGVVVLVIRHLQQYIIQRRPSPGE